MGRARSLIRRGASEAVAAAIAFTVISLTMLYVLMNVLSMSTVQQAAAMPLGHASEKLMPFLVGGALNVTNIGSVVTQISYVVALDSNLNRVLINAERSNRLCNVSPSRTLPPGGKARIVCQGYTVVAVITESGRVFSIEPQLYALAIEQGVAIPMIMIYGGMMLTTTSGLLRFLENPAMMVGGALDTSVAMSLLLNTSGYISGTLDASLVIVGRNPANNMLNILVIGRGVTGTSVTVGGSTIDLSRVASLRYRLKIENFTGSISVGPGIHPCYVNTSRMCRITLSGSAGRILLYNATRSTRRVVGLDPYVFVGDIDGNDNVEVIFVTQDFSTGSRSSINDVLSISGVGTVSYLDSSAAPIRIVFSETPIDSRRYSSAILSVRMFFWDNSVDDISDNDNRIIVRVGLYDVETKTFVYSTHLGYYELCRYRHVSPFSASYITKDFTVHIPNTGKRYYVAIELLDPFYLEQVSGSSKNDADLIIGLEYVGIALAGR